MKITSKEYKTLKGIIERYEAKKKPTIYDWSNEPEDVMFMCTDGNGWQERWIEEPTWVYYQWINNSGGGGAVGYCHSKTTSNSPFKGDCKDSLEARPK